jgi:hypothetical protein
MQPVRMTGYGGQALGLIGRADANIQPLISLVSAFRCGSGEHACDALRPRTTAIRFFDGAVQRNTDRELRSARHSSLEAWLIAIFDSRFLERTKRSCNSPLMHLLRNRATIRRCSAFAIPQSRARLNKMVALLAPVPEEHLVSALDVVHEHKKVAFRSRSWQLFRQIDELRGDAPADVLIYASHSTVHHSPPTVSWRVKYIGQREASGGAHPDGMTYRPLSTTEYPDDNKGHGLFSGKSVIGPPAH